MAGTSTQTQAVFNVVNVMMGVGLLSLPFALKSSGWVGLVLLWLMGIVANSTGGTYAGGEADRRAGGWDLEGSVCECVGM